MFVNFINLTLTGLGGYFDFEVIGASHTRFAIFMILIFTITETVVMYFFITTGKAIKTAINDGLGEQKLLQREKTLKMKLFPQLMLTILLVGGWFIHIGAVENSVFTAPFHWPLFTIAYLHHWWSLIRKNDAFREQLAIISELRPQTQT
tara:strand:+ start:895 stop:1341 length:447 start_codon:yes stop_codon:yes gene_type:complete